MIALSHGGVEKGPDGRYVTGEDVQLAKDIPGIDVVISGHSHTELKEPIIVNGRTPMVQTGKESNNLGELVIALDGNKLAVISYRLLPIDDSILGDRTIGKEIDQLKESVSAAAFASRGYSIDQPLAIAPLDLPNTFTDIAAGTLLENLVTDSFRAATKADIAPHSSSRDLISFLSRGSCFLNVIQASSASTRSEGSISTSCIPAISGQGISGF